MESEKQTNMPKVKLEIIQAVSPANNTYLIPPITMVYANEKLYNFNLFFANFLINFADKNNKSCEGKGNIYLFPFKRKNHKLDQL